MDFAYKIHVLIIFEFFDQRRYHFNHITWPLHLGQARNVIICEVMCEYWYVLGFVVCIGMYGVI